MNKKSVLSSLIKNMPQPENIKSQIKIVTFPAISLAIPSLECNISDQKIYWQKLVKYMCNAMQEHNGIGLAASQIGCNVALFVLSRSLLMQYSQFSIDGSVIDEARVDSNGHFSREGDFLAIFNPDILYLEDNINLTHPESCISVPIQNHTSQIRRQNKIQLTFQTIDGNQYKVLLADIISIVVQHELDHLRGIVYMMRIENEQTRNKTLNMYCKLNMINQDHVVLNSVNLMLDNIEKPQFFQNIQSMTNYMRDKNIEQRVAEDIIYLTCPERFLSDIDFKF